MSQAVLLIQGETGWTLLSPAFRPSTTLLRYWEPAGWSPQPAPRASAPCYKLLSGLELLSPARSPSQRQPQGNIHQLQLLPVGQLHLTPSAKEKQQPFPRPCGEELRTKCHMKPAASTAETLGTVPAHSPERHDSCPSQVSGARDRAKPGPSQHRARGGAQHQPGPRERPRPCGQVVGLRPLHTNRSTLQVFAGTQPGHNSEQPRSGS